MPSIDRSRIATLMERERQTFRDRHPRSGELEEQAKPSLLFGVPMNWMIRWPGDWPVFVDHAEGAHFTDVDGNTFVDFCLGDTGGMAGHGPKASVAAIAEQAAKGITLMLPTEDAAWVGTEMTRRFKVPLLAVLPDGDRCQPVRPAVGPGDHRPPAGRRAQLELPRLGRRDVRPARRRRQPAAARRADRQAAPLELTTKVVEINDLEALEAALAPGDVAAVLFEPALTNIGIVLPDPGYHQGVRDLCTKYGTLLVIDETHTICAGPGGCTKAWDLDPDLVTIGKTLGAGVPSARLRHDPGGRHAHHRSHRLAELRRGRDRRDARRQRAVAGRDARHPGRGAHRRGVRTDGGPR